MAVQSAASDGLFDPAVTPGQAVEFGKGSRGYETDKGALAKLVTGLGDVASQAVGLTDDILKRNAQEEARQAATELRDQRIQDAQTAIVNVPRGIQSGLDSMRTAAAARDQGRISDTQYYTNLDITSRMLRNKYSGYRDYIDQEIKKVTGVDPANALMRKLVEEADKAKIEDDSKSFRAIRDRASFGGTLPADFDAPGRAEYYEKNPNAFAAAINKMQLQKAKEGSGRVSVASAYEGRQPVTKAAQEASNREIDNIWANAVAGSERQFGPTWDGLMKTIQTGLLNGKPRTPEENAALNAELDNMERSVINKVRTRLTNEKITRDGKTYKDLGVDVDEAIRPIQDRIKMYRSAIAEHNYGIVAVDSTGREAQGNGKIDHYIVSKPINWTMATLRTNLPPDIIGSVVDAGTKTGSPEGAYAVQAGTAQTVSGNRNIGFKDSSAEISRAYGQDPETAARANSENLRKAIDIITNDKAPPQTRLNAAFHLYGPENKGFLKGVSEKDKNFVYQVMSSPKVSEKIFSLGDATLKEAYTRSVTNDFMELHRKQTQDVRDVINQAPNAGLRVVYDPQTYQFAVSTTNQKGNQKADPAIQAAVRDAVNGYNRILRNFATVFETGGRDPNAAIEFVFKRASLPLFADAVGYQQRATETEQARLEAKTRPQE